MDMLRWRTPLNPVFTAALILGLLVWMIFLYQRRRKSDSVRRTILLLAPKVLIVILLICSYFDPVWTVVQHGGKNRKVLVLTDDSSSMAVVDSEDGSRSRRAGKLRDKLKSELKSLVDVEVLAFDEDIRKSRKKKQSDGTIVGTDLGRSLVSLAKREDISDCLAFVMITDGGDELLQNVRLPEVPGYIAGIGTDPDQWDDLAIVNVETPDVVELNADLKLYVDVVAYSASQEFASRVRNITVRLEEKEAGNWRVRDSRDIRLDSGSDRAEFIVPMLSRVGINNYRVSVPGIRGELSDLNNTRDFSVEVRDKTLSVLFYVHELGWDFAMIRKELARDPSVALTALFRITGERFVVQGERQRSDESLQKGFPSDPEILEQYKCIIIGSIPSANWRLEQLTALTEYVRNGGAVVFLGGEHSFGGPGYANAPIGGLLPWSVPAEKPEFRTGKFPVKVPVSVSKHSVMARTSEFLAQAGSVTIESVNITGRLKTGAISLLDASLGNRDVSVVGLQRYGKGQVMAVASNTLWRWAKTSETLRQAYGHLWRAGVRHIGGLQEGGRLLSVKWDSPHYSPGQQAVVNVDVGGTYERGQLHLRAELKGTDGVTQIPVEQVAGRSGAFTAAIVFTERDNYLFQLEAFVGDELLESYEKPLSIGPRLNEGANLQVDHVFLDDLARRSGGYYVREKDAEKIIQILRNRILDQVEHLEVALVNDRHIFIVIFLCILALEWFIRRKMNLF